MHIKLYFLLVTLNTFTVFGSYVIGENSAVKNPKSKTKPNILLIGIETLRADHLSCMGYHRKTTPTLDKLAKEGVVFTKAIATSSWTLPSVMSIFTSLYPGVHGKTQLKRKSPESVVTLAQLLKSKGYKTVAFVSNPLLDHSHGFSRGFDLYDDFTVDLHVKLNLFLTNENGNKDIRTANTNSVINRIASKWLRKNYEKPFFMFVFYFDPHFDYVPQWPYDTIFDPNYTGTADGRGMRSETKRHKRPRKRDLEHIIALYDGEVLCVDNYISQLLNEFKKHCIFDDTLVVVLGDHGDEFYEHGSTGHRHSLYNELIHIPLIFRWPRQAPQNMKIDALVSQVDIMPTILDYLNIEHDGLMQGRSLRDLINGGKNKIHNVVYAQVNEGFYITAVMNERYKLIFDIKNSKKQFFDLSSDWSEQNNLYGSKDSVELSLLEKKLTSTIRDNEKLARSFFGTESEEHRKVDDNKIDELKSLGYIQ